jgi:hypothetical protein
MPTLRRGAIEHDAGIVLFEAAPVLAPEPELGSGAGNVDTVIFHARNV